jgi:hypothetical protein
VKDRRDAHRKAKERDKLEALSVDETIILKSKLREYVE